MLASGGSGGTWLMILPEHRIKWRSELPAHCATPRGISDLLEVGKSDASASFTLRWSDPDAVELFLRRVAELLLKVETRRI